MKRGQLLGLGIGLVAMASLGCSMSASGQPTEHTAATRQAVGTESWPINSDCTCPDPGSVSQAATDQCMFAQQFLQILYDHNATWNGGQGFSSSPTAGGDCSDSNLPPLTMWSDWSETWDQSSNSWVATGYILDTPTFNVSDPSGFYNSLSWDLNYRSGPDGVQFENYPVAFFYFGGPESGGYCSFEPTNCGNCFARY